MNDFARAMRQHRLAAGIGLRALARAAYADPGHLSRIEHGTRQPTPELAAAIDTALHADGRLAALAPAPCPVDATVRDTQRLAALLAAEPTDAADTLGAGAADLAVAYLGSPAPAMLDQASTLRRTAVTALRRARTPTAARDITLHIGHLSGVLAYAALDMGHADAAAAHAELAFAAADRAGSDDLRAWVRGTQSLIARFAGRYIDALRYAENGLQWCDTGTARIRLLCGVAQCAANLGDARAAHEALDAANRARDTISGEDAMPGLFTFSEAKQAYYSGSSLIWLDEHADALRARREADTAIGAWRSSAADERSLDDEALAHVYAATASVQLGDLEAAADYLEPILGLPVEQRISWIRKRMARVAGMLAERPYVGDPLAREIRERIVEYR